MPTASPAGYSGIALFEMLGIKANNELCVINAPDHYALLVAPLPEGVCTVTKFALNADLVHLFVTLRARHESTVALIRRKLQANGMVWVSWPKKASKAPTDITEDTIRTVPK